ncbi:hypothetical protein ACFQ1S_18710, partial [Kibdelosporangium lantanae]
MTADLDVAALRKDFPILQRTIRDGKTLHYIDWDARDGFASTLRLRQYPDIAPVIIDPRFGWG